jgi:hypothetical protein
LCTTFENLLITQNSHRPKLRYNNNLFKNFTDFLSRIFPALQNSSFIQALKNCNTSIGELRKILLEILFLSVKSEKNNLHFGNSSKENYINLILIKNYLSQIFLSKNKYQQKFKTKNLIVKTISAFFISNKVYSKTEKEYCISNDSSFSLIRIKNEISHVKEINFEIKLDGKINANYLKRKNTNSIFHSLIDRNLEKKISVSDIKSIAKYSTNSIMNASLLEINTRKNSSKNDFKYNKLKSSKSAEMSIMEENEKHTTSGKHTNPNIQLNMENASKRVCVTHENKIENLIKLKSKHSKSILSGSDKNNFIMPQLQPSPSNTHSRNYKELNSPKITVLPTINLRTINIGLDKSFEKKNLSIANSQFYINFQNNMSCAKKINLRNSNLIHNLKTNQYYQNLNSNSNKNLRTILKEYSNFNNEFIMKIVSPKQKPVEENNFFDEKHGMLMKRNVMRKHIDVNKKK